MASFSDVPSPDPPGAPVASYSHIAISGFIQPATLIHQNQEEIQMHQLFDKPKATGESFHTWEFC